MPWAKSCREGEGLPLPKGFISISDITQEKVKVGSLTNVIGLVKDYRAPVETSGRDFKSTMVIYDMSTEEEAGIDVSVFRPEQEHPNLSAGDVVLLYHVKVQRFRSDPISLITNYSTCIVVYRASDIPRPPLSASVALMPQVRKTHAKVPKESENNYVSYLYHAIDKGAVPTQEEFSIKVDMSKNVKKKFSLLQDVTDNKFHDLIVQVAREPYDLGDKVTLYVSDYTENDKFFEYTRDGVRDLDTRGDVWGYTTNKSEGEGDVDEWAGPYGKKAMQITVYEPHATYAREELHAGDWVYIKNVQIKHGADGRFLEGFLREARNLAASTNYMDVLDIHDLDNVDKKLRDDFKNAIRRWRDHTKKKKADNKRIKSIECGSSKRKHSSDSDEPSTQPKKSAKLNSKQRRNLKRAETERKAAEEEARAKAKAEQDRAAEAHDLNSAIVCEHPDKPVTPVSGIVEHVHYETTINSEAVTLILPFVNRNYRANVRVVDFFPDRLEDFASSRRRTQFDVLSENSDEDSDSSSGSDSEDGSRRRSDKVWEWRFALLLEDARRKKSSNPAQRVWVLVDNLEGQYLTGLDASDLRQDKNNLTTLRESMFCLWGELEEHKHGVLATREERMRQKRKPGAVPPPTASDVEDDEGGVAGKDVDVSNAAFGCCIRQYGVKVPEKDERKADAGRGKRWKRVYGLFGTKICF